MSKPTTYLNWTDGQSTKIQEPPNGKKLLGWSASERPAFQFMNWLFFQTDQWIQYLDQLTINLTKVVSSIGLISEVPVGTVDDINRDFHLSKLPASATSLVVTLNGLVLKPTAWSLDEKTVRFNQAPALGQEVEVFYLTHSLDQPLPDGGSSGGDGGGTTGPEYRPYIEYITLTEQMVLNGYVTLQRTPLYADAVTLDVIGNGAQYAQTDFIVTSNRVEWEGDLEAGGLTPLSSGDRLRIQYFA